MAVELNELSEEELIAELENLRAKIHQGIKLTDEEYRRGMNLVRESRARWSNRQGAGAKSKGAQVKQMDLEDF